MFGTLCYHKKAEMKKIPLILTILNAIFLFAANCANDTNSILCSKSYINQTLNNSICDKSKAEHHVPSKLVNITERNLVQTILKKPKELSFNIVCYPETTAFDF